MDTLRQSEYRNTYEDPVILISNKRDIFIAITHINKSQIIIMHVKRSWTQNLRVAIHMIPRNKEEEIKEVKVSTPFIFLSKFHKMIHYKLILILLDIYIYERNLIHHA